MMNENLTTEKQINKGKRYIPLDKLSKKKLNYMLYAILQRKSSKLQGQQNRYIYDKHINKTQLAKECGSKPATIRTRIQELVNEGLLTEHTNEQGKYYVLEYGISKKFLLLDLELDVMRELIYGTNNNVLKTYLLLKARKQYLQSQGKKFNNMIVEQEYICESIGLSKASRSLIPDYISVLTKLGLISNKFEYFTCEKTGTSKKRYLYTVTQ